MLLLKSLKVFIFSREINLFRLDTFPIMVAKCSSMYNWILAFRTTLDSIMQLQLYTSLKQTRVAFYDCEKQTDAGNRNSEFYFKALSIFRGVQLNDFMNSYISCGMATPHIIGSSDLAIRKVWFNQNKSEMQTIRYELEITGTSSRTDNYCKSKMQDLFQSLFKGQSEVVLSKGVESKHFQNSGSKY